MDRNNEASLFEIKKESEPIFDGKVVHLYRDTVTLPDGNDATREIIRHIGAVAVLPLTEENEIVMVRQFRYPFNKVICEIPAGKLDSKEEDLVEAALRELKEETGVSCEKLTFIGDIYPSVAILDEVIHMYCAEGLSFGETSPDDDEFLNVVKVPFEDAVNDVLSGKICDAKTQTAILKVKLMKDGGIL